MAVHDLMHVVSEQKLGQYVAFVKKTLFNVICAEVLVKLSTNLKFDSQASTEPAWGTPYQPFVAVT